MTSRRGMAAVTRRWQPPRLAAGRGSAPAHARLVGGPCGPRVPRPSERAVWAPGQQGCEHPVPLGDPIYFQHSSSDILYLPHAVVPAVSQASALGYLTVPRAHYPRAELLGSFCHSSFAH